ncbi:MAG: hypothetical protein WBG86_14640 [Polyangiales bacterium]
MANSTGIRTVQIPPPLTAFEFFVPAVRDSAISHPPVEWVGRAFSLLWGVQS